MTILWKVWLIASIIAFAYCAYVDLQTRRIPNRVTYPFIVGSLLLSFAAQLWPDALWGGLLGGGILLVPRLLAGPKRAGMGDVKMAAWGGLLLGVNDIIIGLFLSFLIALVILLPLILFKRIQWQQAVPFGPYLAVGFTVALLPTLLS